MSFCNVSSNGSLSTSLSQSISGNLVSVLLNFLPACSQYSSMFFASSLPNIFSTGILLMLFAPALSNKGILSILSFHMPH
jgi:hypothetical protein